MSMPQKPIVFAVVTFVVFAAIGTAAQRPDLNASFARASQEFGVPLEIVRAVAYVSSGGVQRQPSTATDRPAAYGVMGLRDDDWFGHSVRDAAALLGVPPDVLRTPTPTFAVERRCWRASRRVIRRRSGVTSAAGRSQNCAGGFTSGTAVSITASPNGTYTFSNWTATNCTLANTNAASTTCTITGTGNASVTARFRKH